MQILVLGDGTVHDSILRQRGVRHPFLTPPSTILAQTDCHQILRDTTQFHDACAGDALLRRRRRPTRQTVGLKPATNDLSETGSQ